jgi:hypothetical protein
MVRLNILAVLSAGLLTLPAAATVTGPGGRQNSAPAPTSFVCGRSLRFVLNAAPGEMFQGVTERGYKSAEANYERWALKHGYIQTGLPWSAALNLTGALTDLSLSLVPQLYKKTGSWVCVWLIPENNGQCSFLLYALPGEPVTAGPAEDAPGSDPAGLPRPPASRRELSLQLVQDDQSRPGFYRYQCGASRIFLKNWLNSRLNAGGQTVRLQTTSADGNDWWYLEKKGSLSLVWFETGPDDHKTYFNMLTRLEPAGIRHQFPFIKE